MGSDKPETSSLAAGTSRISYMVAMSRGRAVRSSSETFVPAQSSSRAGVCIDDLPEDSTESVHRSLVATPAVVPFVYRNTWICEASSSRRHNRGSLTASMRSDSGFMLHLPTRAPLDSTLPF